MADRIDSTIDRTDCLDSSNVQVDVYLGRGLISSLQLCPFGINEKLWSLLSQVGLVHISTGLQ